MALVRYEVDDEDLTPEPAVELRVADEPPVYALPVAWPPVLDDTPTPLLPTLLPPSTLSRVVPLAAR